MAKKAEPRFRPMRAESDGGASNGENHILSKIEVVQVDELIKRLPPLHFYNKHWSVYDVELGCYVSKTDGMISRMICECLENPTVRIVDPLRKHLSWMIESEYPLYTASKSGNEEGSILINCYSGVVDARSDGSMKLIEHSPKNKFGKVIKCNFIHKVGEVEGPEWDEVAPTFMRIVVNQLPPEEDQEVFLLSSANGLIPYKKFEICVVAIGEGGTGKTTLFEAISSVFGDCKTSLTLNEICGNKDYSTPMLWDSMINVGSEIDARELDSTNFKRIVSGESFLGRMIYGAPEDRRSYSKLCFLVNNQPKFRDGGGAEYRRMRFLDFSVPVAPKNRDTRIWDKLEKDKDGIFMLLLKRLARLMTMTEFPRGSKASQEREKEFKTSNDPHGAFVEEYCEVGENYNETRSNIDRALLEFFELHEWGDSFKVDGFKKKMNPKFHFRPDQVTRNGKSVSITWGYRIKQEIKDRWKKCL